MDSKEKTAKETDVVRAIGRYESMVSEKLAGIEIEENKRVRMLTKRANRKKRTIDTNLRKQIDAEAPKYVERRENAREEVYSEAGKYVSGVLCGQYEMLLARNVLTELSDSDRAEAEKLADLKRRTPNEQMGGLEAAIAAIGQIKPNVSRAIDVLSSSGKAMDVVSFVGAGKEGKDYVVYIAPSVKVNDKECSLLTMAINHKLEDLTQASPISTENVDLYFTTTKEDVNGMPVYKLTLKEGSSYNATLLLSAIKDKIEQLQPDEFEKAGLRHIGIAVEPEVFKYLNASSASINVAPEAKREEYVATGTGNGARLTREQVLNGLNSYGPEKIFSTAEAAQILGIGEVGLCNKKKDLPGRVLAKSPSGRKVYQYPIAVLRDYVETHRITPGGKWMAIKRD